MKRCWPVLCYLFCLSTLLASESDYSYRGLSFLSTGTLKEVSRELEHVWGADWSQRWILREHENQSLRAVPQRVHSFRLDFSASVERPSLRELWNLVHKLEKSRKRAQLFHSVELVMTAAEESSEQHSQKESMLFAIEDRECGSRSPSEMEADDALASCDPLWAHKQAGIVQLDAQGEWSYSWIDQLIAQRRSEYAVMIRDLKLAGRLQEAQVYEQYSAEMKNFGAGVLVGQPDTGFTLHPELDVQNRLDHPEGHSLVGPSGLDALEAVVGGHGTATASTIVSPPLRQSEGGINDGPAHIYVQGMAPLAKLRPYRVTLLSPVHISYQSLISALSSILSNNLKYGRPEESHKRIRVISMSLGGPTPNRELHVLLKKLKETGVIIVAAAGNMIPELLLKKLVVWPAAYEEVIAVAASNVYANGWKHTSKGKAVDVTAPGEDVWAARVIKTATGNFYGVARNSGTSFATTTVASIAALWTAFHGESLLSSYGPHRQDLFQYVMTQAARRGKFTPLRCDRNEQFCEDIRKGHFGLGIVNAKAILEEPLPSLEELTESLRGAAENQRVATEKYDLSPAAIESLMQLGQLANYYDLSVLASRFKDLFGVTNLRLNKILEEWGDELYFYLSEDDLILNDYTNYIKVAAYVYENDSARTDLGRKIVERKYRKYFAAQIHRYLKRAASDDFLKAVKLD